MKQRRALHELRVRTCMSMHRCCVCLATIKLGESYHDGGWPRRAHEACAEQVARGHLREHTRSELRNADQAELAAADERGGLRSGTCRACGGPNLRYVGTNEKLCSKCHRTRTCARCSGPFDPEGKPYAQLRMLAEERGRTLKPKLCESCLWAAISPEPAKATPRQHRGLTDEDGSVHPCAGCGAPYPYPDGPCPGRRREHMLEQDAKGGAS
jgi:hypothetical protein